MASVLTAKTFSKALSKTKQALACCNATGVARDDDSLFVYQDLKCHTDLIKVILCYISHLDVPSWRPWNDAASSLQCNVESIRMAAQDTRLGI